VQHISAKQSQLIHRHSFTRRARHEDLSPTTRSLPNLELQPLYASTSFKQAQNRLNFVSQSRFKAITLTESPALTDIFVELVSLHWKYKRVRSCQSKSVPLDYVV